MNDYTSLTNNELCRLYKDNGDQQAFSTLYTRLEPLVSGRLKQLVKHDTTVMEELSQIIWAEAAKAIRDNFKFESDFSTYLYTITTTRFINYFRTYKTSFMDDDTADVVHDLFYTSVKADDSVVNSKSMLREKILNVIECNDFSKNLDILETHRKITLEVLEGHSEEERMGYICRMDGRKSMSALSKELNIPYTRIKETSKLIELEINRRLEEYVARYY